jgi:hypothetical protein
VVISPLCLCHLVLVNLHRVDLVRDSDDALVFLHLRRRLRFLPFLEFDFRLILADRLKGRCFIAGVRSGKGGKGERWRQQAWRSFENVRGREEGGGTASRLR